MDDHPVDQTYQEWIKTGSLLVDLPSMKKGFREGERRCQEIWNYIQYRESLLKWSSMNKEMRESS